MNQITFHRLNKLGVELWNKIKKLLLIKLGNSSIFDNNNNNISNPWRNLFVILMNKNQFMQFFLLLISAHTQSGNIQIINLFKVIWKLFKRKTRIKVSHTIVCIKYTRQCYYYRSTTCFKVRLLFFRMKLLRRILMNMNINKWVAFVVVSVH